MLRYRVGCGGGGRLASYYKSSEHLPEMQAALASYYAAEPNQSVDIEARVRATTHPVARKGLGVDPSVPLNTRQLAHLLNGFRADGTKIEGKAASRNTFIDFTFTAPKSFSVALAFASPAEKRLLEKAYSDAVNSLMDLIEQKIGTASVGRTAGNRASNREKAHIVMIPIEHHTARPTYELALGNDTELIEVMMPGDPNRHTHILTMMPAFTDEGRVTSLYQEGLAQKIHEWGALGQAFLSTNLMKLGVNVELDSTPGLSFNEKMLRLTDVPRWLCDLFSKRHKDGEKAARDYAKLHGMDFDTMSAGSKAKLLRGGVGKTRRAKIFGLKEYESWLKQAKDAGYNHRSVLRPGQERELRPAVDRLPEAFSMTLPMIEDHFERRAVLEGSIPRISAAKALIHTGIAHAGEVNIITAAHRSEGVMQDGQKTYLHWGYDTGTHYARITTQLSVEMETEVVDILSAAFADRSVTLTPEAIERAVKRVEDEASANGKTLSFSTGHGLKQRHLIDKIGAAGKAMVWIGAAGTGKSTALRVPVSAWHEAGRETYGITLAWRQTDGLVDAGVGKGSVKKGWRPDTANLVDAGITAERTFAMEPFLRAVERGRITLTANSTVIVDELGLVGTKHILRLARLQREHGFQFVGLGDDMQCQSIAAGATIDLLRRAFGPENVPELLDSIRQESIRDQDTVAMFRSGDAGQALQRKDVDGTLLIVPGGYREAIDATVDLWAERIAANKDEAGYTLAVTAPTNADCRAIGEAIRSRRKLSGEVGEDLCVIEAEDQNGDRYQMKIAAGDRVRLFDRIRSKHFSIIGNNGSVVTVLDANKDGMKIRTSAGKIAIVGWEALRKDSSNIRLSYGDAVTIDARQSDTVTEHITAMLAGSAGVTSFGIYTADSRYRRKGWIVTSHGAEKSEVIERLPMGHPAAQENDPVKVREAIISNMARNLSRQPKKTLALDFLDRALRLKSGTIDAKTAYWYRAEQKQQDQQSAAAQRPPSPRRRLTAPRKRLRGPSEDARKTPSVREERRSARPTAERPKRKAERKPMDPSEAISQFKDALREQGFLFDAGEDPIMDGSKQRHRVEGDRGRDMSGIYHGYLDGRPAGSMTNFRLGKGKGEKWVADSDVAPMTPEERQRIAARRAERESNRLAQEERAVLMAQRIWSRGHKVTRHPYLTRKNVSSHGLRQDNRGNLIVPAFDEHGVVKNVQTIPAESGGKKMFVKSAPKKGLFGVIGRVAPGGVLIIAEGYATAETLHRITGFPVAYAFDVGNVLPAAQSLRRRFGEDVTFVFAGDNDHHHLTHYNPPLPNVGKEAAEAGAIEFGGFSLIPEFGSLANGKLTTDWQDHAELFGDEKTSDVLKITFERHGISMPGQRNTARAQLTQSDRDASRKQDNPSTPVDPGQAAAARAAQSQREAQNKRHNQGPEL